MSDPFQPSPEEQAFLDQLMAGTRLFAERLEACVQELKIHGWTDEQARELILATLRSQS